MASVFMVASLVIARSASDAAISTNCTGLLRLYAARNDDRGYRGK
jgi:hypothetical protein